MAYPKAWKSFQDQLVLLQSRGLVVSDRNAALECLRRVGYYRLSGYWYPFRERVSFSPLTLEGTKPKKPKVQTIAIDSFRSGSSFKNVMDLYVFDKKLRSLVADALERIEIALRVDISHMLGKHNPLAYVDSSLFKDEFVSVCSRDTGLPGHHRWLGKHAQLIGRSREDFVAHNKKNYGLPLAIWVACEVWDFGTMTSLFEGMKDTEQDRISEHYKISNGRILSSWLKSLNYLRNICAHHSRLWNRNMEEQPRLPPAEELDWADLFSKDAHARARCYLLLRMTRHLLETIHPKSTWADRLRSHLDSFPSLSHVQLDREYGMGMPEGWQADWRAPRFAWIKRLLSGH